MADTPVRLIDQFREENPNLGHLSDDRLVNLIRERRYPDRSYDEVAKAFDVAPVVEPQRRGIGTTLNDWAIEAGNAAAGLTGAVTNFFSPGNAYSQAVDEFVKQGESMQSDVVKAAKAKHRKEVDAADGFWEEAAATAKYYGTSPGLAVSEFFGNVGPFSALRGVNVGARLLGAGEKAAAGIATGVGAAAGGAASGGDAAGTAYQMMMDPNTVSDDQLIASGKGSLLYKQGVSVADIRERLAQEAARRASYAPAVMGAIAGGTGVERIFAGGKGFGRLGTAGIEAFTGAVDEGLSTYSGQSAVSDYNPTIDPMKGVGSAATAGGLLDAIGGVAFGGREAPAPTPKPQPQRGIDPSAPVGTQGELFTGAEAPLNQYSPLPGIESAAPADPNAPEVEQDPPIVAEIRRLTSVMQTAEAQGDSRTFHMAWAARDVLMQQANRDDFQQADPRQTGLPFTPPPPPPPAGPPVQVETRYPGGLPTEREAMDLWQQEQTENDIAQNVAQATGPMTRNPALVQQAAATEQSRLAPQPDLFNYYNERQPDVAPPLELENTTEEPIPPLTRQRGAVAVPTRIPRHQLDLDLQERRPPPPSDQMAIPNMERNSDQLTLALLGEAGINKPNRKQYEVAKLAVEQYQAGVLPEVDMSQIADAVATHQYGFAMSIIKDATTNAQEKDNGQSAAVPAQEGQAAPVPKGRKKRAPKQGRNANEEGGAGLLTPPVKQAAETPPAAAPASKESLAALEQKFSNPNVEPAATGTGRAAWEDMRTEDMLAYDDLDPEIQQMWDDAVADNAGTGDRMDNLIEHQKRNERARASELTQRARESWEEKRKDGEPSFEQLGNTAREMWEGAVEEGVDTRERMGEVLDARARNTKKANFRDGDGAADTGRDAAAVQNQIDAETKNWKNKPKIKVVQKFTDLPADAQQQGTGAEPGVFYDGMVYLVADNLKKDDGTDALRTVMHEVVGHYGLRGLLGKDFRAVMEAIFTGNSGVRRKAIALMKSKRGMARWEAVDEVLAEMAETAPRTTSFLAALEKIRQWIVKTFLHGGNITTGDVHRLIQLSRDYVVEGTTLQHWAGRDGYKPVLDKNGKMLRLYHGTANNSDIEEFRWTGENGGVMKGGLHFVDKPRGIVDAYAWTGRNDVGGAVYAVYARAKNMLTMDPGPKFGWGETFIENVEKEWNKGTYDGINYPAQRDGGGDPWSGIDPDGPTGRVYVLRKPEQVKSAIGNNGDYAQTKKEIHFSTPSARRWLDDNQYFYHSVRDDADIDAIMKGGLRAGTNVSRSDGQAFNEGDTVLVFKRSDYKLRGKGYQADEVVTYGAGKPVAILKDTQVEATPGLPQEQVDAGLDAFDKEWNELEQQADGLYRGAGMQDRGSPTENAAALDARFDRIQWAPREQRGDLTKDLKAELGDLYDRAYKVWKDRDNMMRRVDSLPTIAREGVNSAQVIERYKKYGVPVEAINLVYNEETDRVEVEPPRFRSREATAANSTLQVVGDEISKLGESVVAHFRSLLSASKDSKKIGHIRQMLTNDQLVDAFPEIEGLTEARDFMNQAGVETNKMVQQAATIDRDWLKLNKAESDRLSNLMQMATLLKVHPELPLTHDKHKHLYSDPNAAANHAKVQRAWSELSPEAKKVYFAARDLLAKFWDDRGKAYRTSVERIYDRRMEHWNKELERATTDAQKQTAQTNIARLEGLKKSRVDEYENRIKEIAGPYFPLSRFGSYIVVADSKQLSDLRNKLDAAEGEAYSKLAKEIDKLERDPAHYIVEAYDHRSQAEQRVRELGLNFDAYWQHGKRFEERQRALTLAGLRSLELNIESEFDRATASRINEVATEFYLQMSPAMSALKRQLERRGIAGANPDMHRAFADAVRKDSQYIPQLEYAGQITDALMRAERSAKSLARKGQQYAQLIVDEMKMRNELDATVKDTPVQDALLTFSYWKNLALSPAFLFANLTQPYTTTVPQLIKAHTLGRTTGAFASAMGDAWRGVVTSFDKGWRSAIDFAKVTDNAQERAMLQDLLDSGAIDITMRHDLGISARAKTRAGELMNAISSFPVQHTEVVNRVSSALAAYRLARSHPTKAKTHEAAVDYARKIVNETQINYNPTNAARLMREGGPIPFAKVIFQFRRYQQGMFYVLARDMHQAVKGKSPEERKEARRAVFATLAIQSAFAGSMGWPVAFPLLGLAKLVAGAFGDDDEPFDPEVELRNWLTDQIGADGARVFMNGLPTMLGMNLTKNIGFGEIFNPMPFLRTNAQTGREAMGNFAAAAGGAAAGAAVDVWDGVRLLKDGQLDKGLEKIIPLKPAVNVIKAHRYATEGITTGQGEPAYGPDNFSQWDIVLRGIGFQSQKEADYWMATIHKEDVVQANSDARSRLLRDWSQAKMKGESTADIDEKIDDWNAKQPKELKITMSDKLKSRKTRDKAMKERGDSGVRVRKNEKYVRDELRFLGE